VWALGRFPGDVIVITAGAGWTWLVCVHLLIVRPPLRVMVWPLAFLLAVTLAFDFRDDSIFAARLHAMGLLSVLWLTGALWRWTGYTRAAPLMGGAEVTFYGGRLLAGTDHAAASIVVLLAFALLAAGAVISWHKRALLAPAVCEEQAPSG
jgi:hypothetical protein